MTVLLDGTAVVQPTSLADGEAPVYTDHRAIAGRRKRFEGKDKKWAQMTWDALSATEYREIYDIVTAETVGYSNDRSSHGVLSFIGLAVIEEEPYLRGPDYKGFKVSIVEQ